MRELFEPQKKERKKYELKDKRPVIPFSNGGGYYWWDNNNCSQCSNAGTRTAKTEAGAKCKLEYHLSLGTIIGEIPIWVATEVGITKMLRNSVSLESKCRKFIKK